jgi:glycosyltransferase involved in cell wall biosynthesis
LLINEYWTEEMVADLYLDIDCYISTHRSEGYGLTVSHALAAGKYVIATDFGGVTDFLNKNYSGLIPYELIQVGTNNIYPPNALWADPNFEAAAELMREAFEQSGRTRDLGIAAGEIARAEFTIEKSAEQITQFLSLSSLKVS